MNEMEQRVRDGIMRYRAVEYVPTRPMVYYDDQERGNTSSLTCINSVINQINPSCTPPCFTETAACA
jgi:hypothetical protein